MVATQIFVVFTLILGEDEPNLSCAYLKMGWFTHQLLVVKSCVGGSDMSDGLLIKVCITKDPFVCPKKGISATVL